MMQEELKTRLALIEETIKITNQEIQQKLANLNLLEGGRQECNYWLNKPEDMKELQEIEITDETQLDGLSEDKKQNSF